MAANKSSLADKQTIVGKITKRLKKEYGNIPKRESLPVLESLIYAICLEDVSYEEADTTYAALTSSYHDWNEIRVTTISELESTFAEVESGEWRAMRIRYLLYYIFDHQYSYDFDGIKKKTQELIQKQLLKIKHLTPFVRNWLLQNSLGNHVIALDSKMWRLAIWLGLLPHETNIEDSSEAFKSLVRKADGLEFAYLFKCLSVSSKSKFITRLDLSHHSADINSSEALLEDLLSGKASRRAAGASPKAEPETSKRLETTGTTRTPSTKKSSSASPTKASASALAPKHRPK